MKKIQYLIFIAIIGSFSNCKKEENYIPEVYVQTQILASEIGGIGQAIYIQGGVRGIVIYREGFDNYLAYDRACSYNPQESCEQIELDDFKSPSFFIDSCCGSTFFLNDGTASGGPTSLPLKQYNAITDGSYVYISN